MAFGIFEEILRLVEYIPIRSDVPINSKLEDRVTMDSQFRFHDIDGVATRLGIIEPAIDSLVSLRDIVKLLNKFLKDGKIEEIVSKKRYNYYKILFVAIIILSIPRNPTSLQVYH